MQFMSGIDNQQALSSGVVSGERKETGCLSRGGSPGDIWMLTEHPSAHMFIFDSVYIHHEQMAWIF
jgi:hypothetical protein